MSATEQQIVRCTALPLSSADSDAIDAWVAKQLEEPWPLNAGQLDLIRRALHLGNSSRLGEHVI
jgi:hypothetical protein